jgi:hypothetical protein
MHPTPFFPSDSWSFAQRTLSGFCTAPSSI